MSHTFRSYGATIGPCLCHRVRWSANSCRSNCHGVSISVYFIRSVTTRDATRQRVGGCGEFVNGIFLFTVDKANMTSDETFIVYI